MQVSHPEFFITGLKFSRVNERDFLVPNKRRALAVAVSGNTVPGWRGQPFLNLFLIGKPISMVANRIDLTKNVFAVQGFGNSGKP
jgi:hypothetical protein